MKCLFAISIAILFSIFLASLSHAAEQRILTVNCLDKLEVMNDIRRIDAKLRFVAIDSYGRGVLIFRAKNGLFTIGFVPKERDDLICPIFWGVESALVDEVGEER